MHDRTKKYPSFKQILENDANVSVIPVSQHPYTNKETENGICLGLGTIHLLNQLQSTIPHNPFDHPAEMQEARDLQIACRYLLNHRNVLEKKLPIHDKKNKERLPHVTLSTLNNKLLKKIEEVKNDEISRGTYIAARINRNPENGQKLEDSDIDHSTTMTFQKHRGELFCTGLDSNFFFASGKGEEGCKTIVRKMTDTFDAYDATDIYTYTNKKII
jgi:hypothetical protein